MRCISIKEAEDVFTQTGFGVGSDAKLQRTGLRLEPEIAARQARVGGQPTPHVSNLPYFAEAVNRWHPPNMARVLWVESWDWFFPSAYELFMAARKGLGETRSIFDAPGHYFDPYPYDERDQTAISPEQARETGILVGLMSLVMINGWDGWFVAVGSQDTIEFWEGNLFFYSDKKSRLREAESLMKEFDCQREIK